MGTLLSGCGSLHYLLQAGIGQMALFSHARPIEEVLKDNRTPPRIKALLAEIGPIKSFGEQNGLKPTGNYTDYVKLDRRAAVWVVSACEPLQFKSKEWSFPIVGAFPYLGWFNRSDAVEYADELKKEGWDVDLRGASAYSTLGWFRDAVLSTMIPEGDESLGELANVVIHESVHATLYIQGQAYFNESLASFVADRLTVTYLDQTKGKDSKEKKAYLSEEDEREEIEKRFHETYQRLAELYSSTQSDLDKKVEKDRILQDLKLSLKFKRDINNATLIQYKTYNTGDQEFEALLKECGGSWTRFMSALKKLNQRSFSKPQEQELKDVLSPLIREQC